MRLRYIGSILCAVTLLSCAACVAATPSPTSAKSLAPKIWRSNFADAQKEAQRLDRPMLVHFYADWCGPCKKMDGETLNSPELARALDNRVIAVKLNSDKNLELVERYDVQSLPTDLFLEPDGRIIMRSSAYQPKSDYLAHLARAEARWVQTQKLKIAKNRVPAKTPDSKIATPSAPAHKPANTPQQPAPAPTSVASASNVGLDGFSPVALGLERKWIKGDPHHSATYRDIVYHMASGPEVIAFNEDADRFVPKLFGCDPVMLWKTDRAYRGMAKYGVFYNNELYLFVSTDSRDEFKSRPERYSRARQVLRQDEIESEESRRAAIETETSPH